MYQHLIRKTAVAGHFYPEDPHELSQFVQQCLPPCVTKTMAIGIVSPHAGYIYSGAVAGAVYSQIIIPDCCIILSPNHTGLGKPCAIIPEGQWETPLGTVPIDTPLAEALMADCTLLESDTASQEQEHALEVQLPFLQYLNKNIRFVPITLGSLALAECLAIGQTLAQVIKNQNTPILIIASSDMNHYEDQATTLSKNQLALDEILRRDPKQLYRVVREHNISMCGIMPTTAMLAAANELGATHSTLISHRTSGDVNHDYASVVGYASLIIQ